MLEDNDSPAQAAAEPQALLTVTHPFDDYQKGDQIFDAEVAEAILASRPAFVVRVGKERK